MSQDSSNDLAHACTDLIRRGNDFPVIWATCLRSHPLVGGNPRHRHHGARCLLEIPLNTGERLVLDIDAKKFRLS